jgi:ATP-binding cassette, subfamily B (MDR/TAP), member 1
MEMTALRLSGLGPDSPYQLFRSADRDQDTCEEVTIKMDGPSPDKDEAVPSSPKSSFKDLFIFVRHHQGWIPACAVATALATAASKTAYVIFLGSLFNFLTEFGAQQINSEDFLSQVSQWCLYLCALGLSAWLAASVDMALWITTGELQGRSARERVFRSLLAKQTAWFDSRDKGMASLAVGIQT